jgi:predicted transposase/invertase (TIGR01784 family)
LDLLENTPLDKLSKEDKWVLYLNDCGGEVMEQIVTQEPMIARALTVGELFSRDQAEQQRARHREEAIVAWNIAMGANYHSCMEKGKTEGKAEGKGEKAFEVARSMLADGLPAETIRKYTGLDESDILALS